jgi:hypothetical protein
LEGLFEDEKASEVEGGSASGSSAEIGLDALPMADEQDLRAKKAAKSDWVSRNGARDRSFKGQRPRTSDSPASNTDPDATPMEWAKKGGTSLVLPNATLVGGLRAIGHC